MATVLRKISTNKIIRTIASLKITVTGLLLIFILTFWGTVAQVENGLYAAQERYFGSFYFLAMGFLPFPGGQLVLWMLFFNILAAFVTRLIYVKEKLGLITTHFGLILFLVSAFVIFHGSQESHLTLREGHSANVSQSYSEWEIAMWPADSTKAKVINAVDLKSIAGNKSQKFSLFATDFVIKTYYPNSQAFSAPFADVKEKYLNASGINILKEATPEKEHEKNTPGIILKMSALGEAPLVLLFGAENEPTKVTINDKDYLMELRHQKFPLPIKVKLIDFMMEKHPGTEMARAYKSKVEIDHDGVKRELIISMNEPFRFKKYTFYQSSYQIDSQGREISTFAVVKNTGRVLPYIATFVVFFGLGLHFLIAAFKFRKAKK